MSPVKLPVVRVGGASAKSTHPQPLNRRRVALALRLFYHDPRQITQVKQRLIESYLHCGKHYAIELCPQSRYHRDLPDLIGIANLTVVEVISRTDLTQVGDLTSYLAAYIRGRLREATINDGLIPITPSVRTRARQRGEASRFEALDRLLGLDEQMEWFETDDLEEPPAKPVQPTEAAPERDPEQRAQVETWLSYLSPHAQAVLRLRYVLSDENERRHTTAEIVRLLGIRRTEVQRIEREALLRLRAFVEGRATLVQRHGQPTIAYPAVQNRLRIPPEQEEALSATGGALQAQGVVVTARALAQAAVVGQSRAQQSLRQHRDQFPAGLTSRASRHEQRLAHVAAVYADISPRTRPSPLRRRWPERLTCASRTPGSFCESKGARARRGTEIRREVKRSTTPTFLLELPLRVDAGQAKRLRVHFEAVRCLYNALLGEVMKRLRPIGKCPTM